MRYKSILATECHLKVTSIRQLKNEWCKMGFFLDEKAIGVGELRYKTPTSVSTDGTEIYKKFRRKGHGIQLYLELIKTAKRLGALKIYSGRSLNKLSTKMWNVKLRKYFKVHRIGGCGHCGKDGRYFINL